MTRRKRNPALLAGLTIGSMTSQIQSLRDQRTARRRARQERKESKALVPYRPQPVLARSTAAQIRTAETSSSSLIVPAPVAAGMMMRGVNYTFAAAPIRNGACGIRINGRQIWATIQGDGTTTKAILPAGTGVIGYTLTFDPDDLKTMPAPLTNFAACFARYVLKRCRIVYTPAVSTATSQGLALSVNTDAAAIQAVTSTSFSGILQNSNAAGGAVWGMMSLDVPCDDTLRYTSQSVADGSLSYAEERQDHAFGVLGAFQSTGSAAIYGYLHIEYVMDFYEVINQNNEASLLRLEQRAAILRGTLRRDRLSAVGRKDESSVREEEKAPISPSSEVVPQGQLSDGCTPVPVAGGWRLVSREPPTPPVKKVQSLKS